MYVYSYIYDWINHLSKQPFYLYINSIFQILTVTLSEAGGFLRSLDCFTFIRLKIGEPVRFKSLINMMNVDSQQNFIFKVSVHLQKYASFSFSSWSSSLKIMIKTRNVL